MLALTDVVDLFLDEFSSLGAGRLTFARIFARALHGLLVGHRSSS
ncbi:MAG: hypothetical protein ACLPPV_18915 [Candidatus Korobacteraceae bacterium]